MNYYNEIKNEVLYNELSRTIKNYLISQNILKAYFKVGMILDNEGKHYGEKIILKYSKK